MVIDLLDFERLELSFPTFPLSALSRSLPTDRKARKSSNYCTFQKALNSSYRLDRILDPTYLSNMLLHYRRACFLQALQDIQRVLRLSCS